ncbi:hypothetical protein PF010_g33132, partial [Phytophthora fragariae]
MGTRLAGLATAAAGASGPAATSVAACAPRPSSTRSIASRSSAFVRRCVPGAVSEAVGVGATDTNSAISATVDVAADSLANAAAVSGAGSVQVTGSDDSAAVDDTVAVLARFVGLLLEEVLLGRLLFLDMMMCPLSECQMFSFACHGDTVTRYITVWHLVANLTPINTMPSVPPRDDKCGVP